MIAAMAAGAAHELNNPLSVISGRAQIELARCEDPARREGLQSIVDQTNKATGIVNELMSFAKPNAPEPVSLSLRELLDMRRQHCETAFGLAAGQLAVQLADPGAVVYADPIHVRDILDAVIKNAIEAGGAESVHVQINSPSRRSDETVRIVVEDDGPGMSREVMARALDPFFSHRPAGRGRGLGLSRAYRLAEINKGRLRIDSVPGHGTKVTIELPARP
jgi:signal transduction histidine kinase